MVEQVVAESPLIENNFNEYEFTFDKHSRWEGTFSSSNFNFKFGTPGFWSTTRMYYIIILFTNYSNIYTFCLQYENRFPPIGNVKYLNRKTVFSSKAR